MSPERLYVAVDASLPEGHRLAQCAHAVAEAHALAPEACRRWREASNTVVVVEADRGRLEEVAALPGAAPFFEPDRGGALTSVAILPRDPESLRRLRRLPLAGAARR